MSISKDGSGSIGRSEIRISSLTDGCISINSRNSKDCVKSVFY